MALQVDGNVGASRYDLDAIVASDGKGTSDELGGYALAANGFRDASAIHIVDGGAVDLGDVVPNNSGFIDTGYGESELRLAGVMNDVVGRDGHFG